MLWMLAAAALSAAQQTTAANNANEQKALDYSAGLKSIDSENKAIMEANTANVIRTGYRVGIQNLQTARMKKQAIEQGYDVSVQGMQILGDNLANAAAAGTVGASVDAAVDLIKKKQDEAFIDVDQTYAENLVNSNLALEQIIMQGKDSLQTARDINSTMPKFQNAGMAGLVAGIGTFANAYAGSKMSLGANVSQNIATPEVYRSATMNPIQALGSPKLNFSANTRLS